jgi:hypothetical protein
MIHYDLHCHCQNSKKGLPATPAIPQAIFMPIMVFVVARESPGADI